MSWTEYNFELIANQNQFVGFIAWWNFNDWRYIEHFSTLPSLRGNGYGFQMIADFIAKSCLPVILEVELPTDDINRRRIGFYQRAGFVLNEHQYKHPPYKKGKKYVPLKIMTYPNAITNENLQHFIKKYHPVIHKLVL